jgi:hypothetical protein
MTIDSTEKASPRLRSALLGAHFARWRRQEHPFPIRVPPGLEQMSPIHSKNIASAVEAGWDDDVPNGANDRMRCSIASALVPWRGDGARNALWTAKDWDADLRNMLRDEWLSFTNGTKQASNIPGLRADCMAAYYSMWRRCQRSNAEDRDTWSINGPVVRTHDPQLSFDPDTWVTTAKEHVEFENVSEDAAESVFIRADPRQWSTAVPDFFEVTETGTWTSAGWIRKPSPPPSLGPSAPTDSSFQLLEHVKWNFSPDAVGGGINVLQISGFEHEHFKSIAYRYRLYHCVQTKLLTTWEAGGLDVDEGSYHAEYQGGGKMVIRASKSLRYMQQPNLPDGFSMLMNLLAPAITSMLMRQLSHDGVLAFLADRERPSRPPATRTRSEVMLKDDQALDDLMQTPETISGGT